MEPLLQFISVSFCHESRRITAPLNSISPLFESFHGGPSISSAASLLPGCGQWTALRQAAPSRSSQNPFVINLILVAVLAH
jgi:hypothetical protein